MNASKQRQLADLIDLYYYIKKAYPEFKAIYKCDFDELDFEIRLESSSEGCEKTAYSARRFSTDEYTDFAKCIEEIERLKCGILKMDFTDRCSSHPIEMDQQFYHFFDEYQPDCNVYTAAHNGIEFCTEKRMF